VELEPHFVVQWADPPFRHGAGIGLGFRASIPIIDPGPIASLNNNLAVSFGLDWAHFGACRVDYPECYGNDFWFPVVMQWNFWLTRAWSVFPEVGIAVHHASWGYDYYYIDEPGPGPGGPPPPPGGPGGPREARLVDCGPRDYCEYSTGSTYISPAMWLGTRYAISDALSIVLRLGYPSLTAGVSFRL
jgi:hypothetical protein